MEKGKKEERKKGEGKKEEGKMQEGKKEEGHSHEHSHRGGHAHLHGEAAAKRSLAPWAIFVIFVLGPCEPLIPLLMYPAARESWAGVLAVTTVFGLVTVATMLLAVFLSISGLRRLRLPAFERYAHALAGSTILACGLAIIFLGV